MEFDAYDGFEKLLVGKTIEKIFLDKVDYDTITFQTNHGTFSWYSYGGCCSSSWIEHIEGVNNLIDANVISVEEVYGERVEDHPEHECLKTYFFKFKTSKGYAQIDMRNSSNGYYGGSFQGVEAHAKTELKHDF